MQRIARDKWWLELATVAAKRSSCPRLQVGAILVTQDSISGVSYNGSPKGEEHCGDVGCLFDEKNYGPHCLRATHAEINLLLGAAQAGISTRGGILVVTHFPCPACLKAIRRAGIAQVYYGTDYYNATETYGVSIQQISYATDSQLHFKFHQGTDLAFAWDSF